MFSWHLKSRGQWRCQTPYGAQDCHHLRELVGPKFQQGHAKVEETCSPWSCALSSVNSGATQVFNKWVLTFNLGFFHLISATLAIWRGLKSFVLSLTSAWSTSPQPSATLLMSRFPNHMSELFFLGLENLAWYSLYLSWWHINLSGTVECLLIRLKVGLKFDLDFHVFTIKWERKINILQQIVWGV